MRLFYMLKMDDMTRDETVKFLKYWIKKIDCAKNGKEGLNLYLEKKHDIIITDIKMPVMNGIEMSYEIKQNNSNTPIIITSAYNDSDFIDKCTKIGIDQFILKPVNFLILIESIRKCMDNIVKEKYNS